MPTLQQIKQKALDTIQAIDSYEIAYQFNSCNMSEKNHELVAEYRSEASRNCVELAQLIMTAGKATEVLTKQS